MLTAGAVRENSLLEWPVRAELVRPEKLASELSHDSYDHYLGGWLDSVSLGGLGRASPKNVRQFVLGTPAERTQSGVGYHSHR